MLFAVVRDENPGLLAHLLDSSDVAELTLGRMLVEMQKDNVGIAKDMWATFLLDRKAGVEWKGGGELSLWGGLTEMFLVFFRKVYAVSYVTECSNGSFVCPEFRCVSQSRSMLQIRSPLSGHANDAQSQLDRQFSDRELGQCDAPIISSLLAAAADLEKYTRVAEVVVEVDDSEEGSSLVGRVCNGQRTMKQLHVPPDCWMVPLVIEHLLESEVFSLPDEIVICGKLFRLRGFVAYDGFLKHFFSYIRLNSNWWYRYCGISYATGSLIEMVTRANGKPKIALYTV